MMVILLEDGTDVLALGAGKTYATA